MIVTASRKRLPQTLPAWNIYLSCTDLPLIVFIKCLTEGKFELLIRDGSEPDEAIMEAVAMAWENIYSDYCELIGGIEITVAIEKAKSIHALSHRIDRVTMLVESMRQVRHPKLIAELAAEPGMRVNSARMEAADAEGYNRELDAVLARLKPEIIKLDGLLKQIPKGDDKPVTMQNFIQNLAQVSKHVKFRISINDITVAEYCTYVRDLRDHVEALLKDQRLKNRR